jgi:hypothetical protein
MSDIRILVSAFTLPALLTTSCTTDSSPRAEFVERDSAGIAIVENLGTLPLNAGTWSVALEPDLSIGAVDGPEELQFYGIAGTHRLPDGRIAMVDSGSRSVRIYAEDGTFLTSFGRRGGGPEEFEMPVLAGTRADTLVIVDRVHHRLSLIHPDAGFVGLTRVSDSVGGFLNPVGTFANGQSVFGGAFDMRRIGELRTGMNRAHTYYRSCNNDGSLAADFGDKDGADFYIHDIEGGGRDSRPAVIPFGRVPVAAVSPDFFFFSPQDEFEIEVYSPSGELLRLIRAISAPEPVSSEDGARHIEATLARVDDPDQETQIRQYLGALPLPETFPPLGALMADALDHLWVQDFEKLWEAPAPWSVFDPDGVLVARLTLPESFNPFEIGPDYILGVGWDEMQVEYLRMYSLERPGH